MAFVACSITGCANTGKMRRGWCNTHYHRWKTHGDPEYVRPTRQCSVEGCEAPHDSRGYCGPHGQRVRAHGDPQSHVPVRTQGDPAGTFERNVEETDGCHEWRGGTTASGYGQLSVDGTIEYAHRYAWARVHGPVPDGYEIDHACRNRACVNVGHLRLATRLQNSRNLNGPRPGRDLPRGVGRARGKFRARIKLPSLDRHLGYFSTVEEAGRVAAEARAAAYGEFAGASAPYAKEVAQ